MGRSISPLQATMYGTGALVFKWFLTISIQSFTAFEAGTKPPEDIDLMPGLGPQDFVGDEMFSRKKSLTDDDKAKKENERRWRRIIQNDVENIPLGIAMAWGTLHYHYSDNAHVLFVVTFSLGRIVYTYFFAKRRQPHRALAWSAAMLGLLGMTVNGMLGVAWGKSRQRLLLK